MIEGIDVSFDQKVYCDLGLVAFFPAAKLVAHNIQTCYRGPDPCSGAYRHMKHFG